ncbi:MAG: hypothetical protein ABR601_03870 [Parasphingopyxis sp.]
MKRYLFVLPLASCASTMNPATAWSVSEATIVGAWSFHSQCSLEGIIEFFSEGVFRSPAAEGRWSLSGRELTLRYGVTMGVGDQIYTMGEQSAWTLSPMSSEDLLIEYPDGQSQTLYRCDQQSN